MGKALTANQEEVLQSIIKAYEVEDQESVDAFDVAERSGISVNLAEQILAELEDLDLIKRGENGVIIEAENNGYYP